LQPYHDQQKELHYMLLPSIHTTQYITFQKVKWYARW